MQEKNKEYSPEIMRVLMLLYNSYVVDISMFLGEIGNVILSDRDTLPEIYKRLGLNENDKYNKYMLEQIDKHINTIESEMGKSIPALINSKYKN